MLPHLYFLLFLFFLTGISAQNQQLENATIFSDQISPGDGRNFTYEIQNTDNGIMVELSSEPSVVALSYENRTLNQLSNINQNLLGGSGNDLSEIHAIGFLCPDEVLSGNSFINISLFDSSSFNTSNYMIRITEYNPSLNDNPVINDELCCPLSTSAKMYTYSIAGSSDSITVFVQRRNERSTSFQDEDISTMLIRYDTCSQRENGNVITDYIVNIPNNVNTSFTIDSSSTPPLRPGSTIYLTFVRSMFGSPPDGSDRISVGVCDGEDCSVSFANGTSNLRVESFLGFVILCLFSSF